MESLQRAIEQYKHSDFSTQAPFVDLYEAINCLKKTPQVSAALRQLSDFGINERTKMGHRFLPMTQRQKRAIDRLLTAIINNKGDTASSEKLSGLPVLSVVPQEYRPWRLEHPVENKTGSGPEKPWRTRNSTGEPKPSPIKVPSVGPFQSTDSPRRVSPITVPDYPWKQQGTEAQAKQMKIVSPDYIPLGYVDLGTQLKKKLIRDLTEMKDIEVSVREFMDLVQGLGDELYRGSISDTLRIIHEAGWISPGFTQVPDRASFLQAIQSGQYIPPKREKIKIPPLAETIVKNLIQELMDGKRSTEEIITEFDEIIEGIINEDPYLKHELAPLFAILKTNLSGVELALKIKNIVEEMNPVEKKAEVKS